MKKSRYSEAQIVLILKEAENGVPVSELCRTHGMSSAAFCQWRSKFVGLDASMISEMKQLQVENARLKRMYADVSMQNELIKEALENSSEAVSTTRDGRLCNRNAARQHRSGVPGFWPQPAVFSLSADFGLRECGDCRLAAGFDERATQMGVWAVLSVSAQRQKFWVESQKSLPDLLRTGAEPAHKAQKTAQAGPPRSFIGARQPKSGVVHGFYGGPAVEWQIVQNAQCFG